MKTTLTLTMALAAVAMLAQAQNGPPPTADLNSSLPPPPAFAPPMQGPTAPVDMTYAPTAGAAAHFYASLAPHGTWMSIEPYGWVWQPAIVATRQCWRPYYDDGRWAWTGNGWYWHSTYAWGWAPFHYGRWTFVVGAGWVWIPELEWGPAWVSWTENDACYGWAPLAPCAPAGGGVGFGISVSDGGVSWSAQISVPFEPYVYVPRRHGYSRNNDWNDSWRRHHTDSRHDYDNSRHYGRGDHDRGDTVIIKETVVQQAPVRSAPARRPNEISRVVAPKPPVERRPAPQPIKPAKPAKDQHQKPQPQQQQQKEKPASDQNSNLPAANSRAMRVARLLAQ